MRVKNPKLPRVSVATAAFALALAFQSSMGWARQTSLPEVHLIGTGGTIAGGSSGSLDARELAELIPDLQGIARLSVEDFSNIGSSRMTPERQFALAQRVRLLFRERPSLSGIVITHGTDSLEETAFLLDLIVPRNRPVVFAAAQRPPRLVDTDGPRNLLNAIRIATSSAMRGLGVLVTLNDEIHSARDVRKTDAIAVEAFASPGVGPIGRVDGDRVFLFHEPARALTVEVERIEPRVSLIRLVAGSDGSLVRAAVDAGARGIVVEVFGRGNVPPAVMDAVRDARSRNVSVVFVTRTGGGRIELGQAARAIGVVGGEDLDGLKARIVLVVALPVTTEPAVLSDYFRRLAGDVSLAPDSN